VRIHIIASVQSPDMARPPDMDRDDAMVLAAAARKSSPTVPKKARSPGGDGQSV
jgi:hypothetical protein